MYTNVSNTIEYAFRVKYGCCPYTYLLRQQENGLSFNSAMGKLQENIDFVWNEMKVNYDKPTES